MSNENYTFSRIDGSFLGKDVIEYTLVALAALVSNIAVHSLVFPLFSVSAEQGSTSARFLTITALTQLATFILLLIGMRIAVLGLKRWQRFRLWRDPRARFEGRWLELFYESDRVTTDGYLHFDPMKYDEYGAPKASGGVAGPRYAIFDITYDEKGDQYVLTGTSYYPNALYYTRWQSRALLFYPEDNRIEYLFTSDGNGDGTSVRGSGILNFRKQEGAIRKRGGGSSRAMKNVGREMYQSGIGSFTENRLDAERHLLEFIRITDAEIDHMVPDRAEMHSAVVLRKFVFDYHRLYGDKLAGGLLDPIKPVTRGRDEVDSDGG